ncbi:MAG: tetratricopeptide repeat protein [Planctomycetota bacterium]
MKVRFFLPLAGLAALTGCVLSPMEEERLTVYQQNAQFYYDRGRYVNAEQQAKQALLLDEGNEKANLILAWSYLKQNERQKLRMARAQFQECLGFWFTDQDYEYKCYLGLGLTCQALGQLVRRDIEDIDRALADPSAPIGEDEAERLRERREDKVDALADLFEESEGAFVETLDRNPDNPQALNGLSQVYVLQGRYDDAIARLERYLRLAEDSREYWERRLEVGHLSIDTERELRDKVDGSFQKEESVRDMLSNIHYERGDYDLALAEVERCIQIAPDEPRYHITLSQCLEKLGRTREAVDSVERYLAHPQVSYETARRLGVYDRLERLRELAGMSVTEPDSIATDRR